MNPEHPQAEGGAEPKTATPAAPTLLRTDIRGLMALVACCGLLLWIAMTLHEGLDPTRSTAAGLRSSSWTHRLKAAEKLTMMVDRDDRVAILALAAASSDDVPRSRLVILDALGSVTSQAIRHGQPEEAVQAGVAGLLRALVDPEPMARQSALNGLVAIAQTPGPHPIDRRPLAAAVVGVLDDSEPSVRLAALHAMMACGYSNTEAPPALVAALEDPDVEVRSAALRALRGYPHDLDRHLPLLLRIVEEGQAETQSACWWAFEPDRAAGFTTKVIPELVAALGSRSRDVRRSAAGVLCQIPTEPSTAAAIPALMAVLREPGVEGHGRDLADPVPVAAYALGRIAPGTPKVGAVLEALTELARSGDSWRQSAAIEAIGQFGPAAEPVVPFLIGVFRSKINQAEWANIHFSKVIPQALGQITPGTESANASVLALIEALEPSSGADPYFQARVVESLDAFGAGAARALPRLRELQKDPNRDLQKAAEQAVSAIETAVALSKETGAVAGGQPEASGPPPG